MRLNFNHFVLHYRMACVFSTQKAMRRQVGIGSVCIGYGVLVLYSLFIILPNLGPCSYLRKTEEAIPHRLDKTKPCTG